jgi:hypothetical protein
MMSKNNIAFILILCTLFFACKKDEATEYSDTPQISFVSISPATVTEFEDSITIVISYVDGDGDLGENNSSVSNLFVTDTRINITYPFRIQQLGPDNAGITIKGKLNVVLKNTGITDGSPQQAVSYQLYMNDRKGNKSNVITTSAITVTQ